MNEIEQRALAFATEAHKGQVRKYTGAPYIHHPIEVADLVRRVSHTVEMVCAAYLHDVVEDTSRTLSDVRLAFGDEVARIVSELTDVSTPADGTRAQRKAIDLAHIAAASAEAQTVKLADLISNTCSVAEHDMSFARVYIPEKWATLSVMSKGDEHLTNAALAAVKYGQAKILTDTSFREMCDILNEVKGRRPWEARKSRP